MPVAEQQVIPQILIVGHMPLEVKLELLAQPV
jgi:hypothetical protein